MERRKLSFRCMSASTRLPWTYWVISLVAVGLLMVSGAVVGNGLGLNPVVSAFLVGIFYGCHELWTIRRRRNDV